jgi:RNA polymerase sigma factor (sigma-70 family)
MSNVSDEEAEKLLKEFVTLRDKCFYKSIDGERKIKSKSKVLHLKYDRCKNICAEKFDYIVKNKVRKYRSFSNYDDLLQDGRLALMLALNSYKLNVGSWFWWANQYVKTKVSREANRHSTIKIPIKQTRNILPYKVSKMPIMTDNSASALENIEIVENANFVHGAISKLSPIQRRVIEMYFEIGFKSADKYSISKICEELDISRKDCVKILSQAKSSLKENLEHIRV